MNSKIKFPVLLFDGVCNLCNNSVQWVLTHDRKAVFRFSALQSETGQRLLESFGRSPDGLDTVVLIDGDRIYTHSDAPLEIARRLGGFWQILYIFKMVPRPLRDAIYRWIARNRYRWFGKEDSCWLPQPKWKARFV
jgi:predicted DCC family thiol-disulfide oxidoreductase YuxK